MPTEAPPVTAAALSHRSLALLRAVRAGRAELICGASPSLVVDGRHVCDTDTAPLTAAELIVPAIPGRPGMRVLAQLSDEGHLALGDPVMALSAREV